MQQTSEKYTRDILSVMNDAIWDVEENYGSIVKSTVSGKKEQPTSLECGSDFKPTHT